MPNLKSVISVRNGMCGIADSKGHLPLRLALESKVELSIIRALLETYPAAAKLVFPEEEMNKDRSYWYSREKPKKLSFLQLALIHKAHVVLLILKHYPDACKLKSSPFAGDLAFQLALCNDYSFTIIRAMLDAFPSIYSVESTLSSSPCRRQAHNRREDARLCGTTVQRRRQQGELRHRLACYGLLCRSYNLFY